jgi:hypothetical protein
VAQMLSQINQLLTRHLYFVSSGLLAVNRHKLVANLRSKLRVVHTTVLGLVLVTYCLVIVHLFLQLTFVLERAVKLSAVKFGFLLPSVDVEAIMKHQDKLNHLRVKYVVHVLTAVSQIQTKNLIDAKAVTLTVS